MRKGIGAFAIIILAGALLGGSAAMLLISRDTETYHRTVRETRLIEAVNRMEFAKRSLQQALAYSFYQASYDVGKVGGSEKKFSDDISYWRIYDSVHYSREKFLEDLKKATSKTFNEYAVVLNSPVKIPQYAFSEVKPESDGTVKVSANVTSGESLELLGEKFYIIRDNPNTTQQISIRTMTIFDELAKNKFLDSDGIKKSVVDAMDGYKRSGSLTACGSTPSADSVFQSVNGMGMSSAENKIKTDDIPKKLAELEDSMTDGLTETDIQNIKVESKITPSCKESTGNCCRTSCSTNSKGEMSCSCSAYDKTNSCDFAIDGAAKVLVKIEDAKKYPVYDTNEKTTDMRNIALQFHIISGTSQLVQQ